MRKTRESVKGFKMRCPNYVSCPLCYGCRSYDPSYYRCLECGKNKKNICDTHKHTDKALNLMIRRPVVELD